MTVPESMPIERKLLDLQITRKRGLRWANWCVLVRNRGVDWLIRQGRMMCCNSGTLLNSCSWVPRFAGTLQSQWVSSRSSCAGHAGPHADPRGCQHADRGPLGADRRGGQGVLPGGRRWRRGARSRAAAQPLALRWQRLCGGGFRHGARLTLKGFPQPWLLAYPAGHCWHVFPAL